MVRVPAVHKTGASGPGRMTSSNIGKHKSFVDDLNTERGIVSTREVSVPRSAEIPPLYLRFVQILIPPKSILASGRHTSTPLWKPLGKNKTIFKADGFVRCRLRQGSLFSPILYSRG